MSTEPTEYHTPIEPTQTAYPNPYEPTSPYYEGVPIPPPPPKQGHKGLIVVLISTVCLVLILGGVLTVMLYQHGQKPTTAAIPTPRASIVPTHTSTATPTMPAPTSTPTPSLAQNYTANDIVVHLQAIDNTIGIESTGESVCKWSHYDYCLGVYAISSVQFTGCPIGVCADTWHYGLWVYATSQDATTAYQQVYNDSLSCTDTSSHADGMYVVCGIAEQEYAHGRCLLLNDVAASVYGQVVTRYCV